jgi:4-diphosphocytidyl-2-C-methyl-D-erythritol kinase
MLEALVKEFAPAKINLNLAVGAKRADGFHPVQSRVAFADIGDQLSFSVASDLSLVLGGPFGQQLPITDDNLVVRAAKALASKAGVRAGAAIHLTKNLPIASGIGGGSADAAASLRGLNRLWDLQLSMVQLAEIGAGLGSDIPACVYSQNLQMGGRGEQIELIPASEAFAAILVNPGVAVSTAAVFAKFDAAPLPASFAGRLAENHLTGAAMETEPVIGEVLQNLRSLQDVETSGLCGSGATCFAKMSSLSAAHAGARQLAHGHSNWWVQVVRIGI